MYNEYFGLEESPFSIAPDPRFLYMSEQHREALAHLVYGFDGNGGFVLITGEVGTGKTTVCRCLLEQIPEDFVTAFVLNPGLTVEELLATICDEFGIRYPEGNRSVKIFVDSINSWLLDTYANGQKAVLIIDEAQNLSSEVLEQLRLLTNLETNQRKLLQVMLLGQPELREKLSRPELRQLSQRIIARYHLGPLSMKDVGAYVAHRLAVAGSQYRLFPESTISKLYQLSGGVPRLINILCDRALLGAYAGNAIEVNNSILEKASYEVFGGFNKSGQGMFRKVPVWILSIITLIAVGFVLASIYYKDDSKNVAAYETIKPDIPEVTHLQSLDWPGDQAAGKSRDFAFQELFRLWGIVYKPGNSDSDCDQAEANGLLCYTELGNLDHLMNLNRPAVLKLFDERGDEYYATLSGMNEDSASLVIGLDRREVSLKEIKSYWRGEYTLLWRPPLDYIQVMMLGMRGPMVKWLDNQLALLQGRRPRENPEFDDELISWLKEFQFARGLIPDGIVGAQTLIHLNSVSGSGGPQLFERQKDD